MKNLVTTILVSLVIAWCLCGPSVAHADEGSPFYFDESGSLQQRGYTPSWSPDNRSRDRSIDAPRYNQFRNQEIQAQNEALLDEYAERNR